MISSRTIFALAIFSAIGEAHYSGSRDICSGPNPSQHRRPPHRHPHGKGRNFDGYIVDPEHGDVHHAHGNIVCHEEPPRPYEHNVPSAAPVPISLPTATPTSTAASTPTAAATSTAAPTSTPPPTDSCGGFDGKKVRIISKVNNLGLARCHDCGPSADHSKLINSVTVHGHAGDSFAKWTLKAEGDKCALISDINMRAARCKGCWTNGPTHPNAVFNHVKEDDKAGYASWRVKKQDDGSFTFMSDTNEYLISVKNGVKNLKKDYVAMVYGTSAGTEAKWDIQEIS